MKLKHTFKHVPAEPLRIMRHRYVTGICPRCNSLIYYGYRKCSCGQLIDWGNIEVKKGEKFTPW